MAVAIAIAIAITLAVFVAVGVVHANVGQKLLIRNKIKSFLDVQS